MAENMLTEVAGPDQRTAKKISRKIRKLFS